MTRRRLDAELVRRGLAASRTEAQEAVRAGLVTVAGTTATKAATMVADDAPVVIAAPVRRYVSRGGEKLHAGLDRFALDPRGRECLGGRGGCEQHVIGLENERVGGDLVSMVAANCSDRDTRRQA